MSSSKINVVIYSNYNLVSIQLLEILLGRECVVHVVSKDTERWHGKTKHLSTSANLSIQTPSAYLPKCEYVFVLMGFSEREDFDFLSDAMAHNNESKIYEVTPYSKKIKRDGLEGADVWRVRLGDVYGLRMDFEMPNRTGDMIREFMTGERVKVRDGATLYYIFAGDVARELVKAIFSYGFNRETFLTEITSEREFANRLQQINPDVEVVVEEGKARKVGLKGEIVRPRELVERSLEETVAWLGQFGKLEKTKPRRRRKINIGLKIKKAKEIVSRKKVVDGRIFSGLNKKYLLVVPVILWLLSAPFILLLVSSLALRNAYENLQVGEITKATSQLERSETLSGIARRGFVVLSWVPLVGNSFSVGVDMAGILEDGAGLMLKSFGLVRPFSDLVGGMLGDKEYDLLDVSSNLATEMEYLYKEASFLETEILALPPFILDAIPVDTISGMRGKLYSSGKVVGRLPTLLGEEKSVTYMVLFQNNMELRPTGGFIGSFGLITFNKGKLIDMQVYDVYSADGQLKGHVEPPAEIKKYLGEATWYLRDSNWDGDFPTSAVQAEWFLEKEMQRSVDGVIGIDLEVAESVLRVGGPLVLTDFNQEITADNLYERVQYEVENDFFPGSRKKANFLTALANALLTRVIETQEADYLDLARELLRNLESRDIQLFVHDPLAARVLVDVGWDGGVDFNKCAEPNCHNISLGLLEANLGVNKANHFIKRKADLVIGLEGNELVHNLTVEIENVAPQALGNKGRYKNYLRLMTNEDVNVEEVVVRDFSGARKVKHDYKESKGRAETGLLVDVSAGSRKIVTFKWREPVALTVASAGKINLNWRKQSGVSETEVSVRVDIGQSLLYNTNLQEDFFQEISW